MSLPDLLAGLPAKSLNGLYLCKSGAQQQVAMDVLAEPVVNSSDHSVLMVISTDALDRDKMFIRQSGILLDYYQLNPVVLYGHGLEGIALPVATAWDHDKNLQIFREETRTLSKAFHSPKNSLSMQMFDAVDCGLLRAASIGITPRRVSSIFYDGERVPVVEQGMLNEWSYCAIGVNPETVLPKSYLGYGRWVEAFHLQCDAAISILNKGRLNEEALLPELRKSFSTLIPLAKRSSSKRATMTNTTQAAENSGGNKLTTEYLKSLNRKELLKACSKANEFDVESQQILKDFIASDEDLEARDAAKPDTGAGGQDTTSGSQNMTPAGDKPVADNAEPVDSSPVSEEAVVEEVAEYDDTPASGDTLPAEGAGATALTDAHEKLQALLSDVKAMFKPVEKDDVKKESDKIFGMIEDAIAFVEGVFSKCYPDNTPLTSSEPEPEDAAKTTGDLVKAFRADDKNPIVFRGLAARIEAMSKNQRIPAEERKSLVSTSRAMKRMETQALAEMAQIAEENDPQALDKISSLEKSLAKVLEQLDSRPMSITSLQS